VTFRPLSGHFVTYDEAAPPLVTLSALNAGFVAGAARPAACATGAAYAEDRMPRDDLPIVEFADQAELERWLQANHACARGAWLKIAKKGAPARTVTHAEALEAAICFGWIDGQRAGLNDSYFLQRFTPRGPRSKWSQVNRDAALKLIEGKRMKPAGLRQVEAAREDGRFDDAYEPQSRATVPPDFQAALDDNPEAAEFFATLRGNNRYAFLYRLHHVKRPEARAKRISSYIEMLTQRETFH
jgi:uncharacterized protein YdeI (YjbR/CyaY-like superfamily)